MGRSQNLSVSGIPGILHWNHPDTMGNVESSITSTTKEPSRNTMQTGSEKLRDLAKS
jgi:hypothetical protein